MRVFRTCRDCHAAAAGPPESRRDTVLIIDIAPAVGPCMSSNIEGRIIPVHQRCLHRSGQRPHRSANDREGSAEIRSRLSEYPHALEREEKIRTGIAPPPIVTQMLIVIRSAAAVEPVVAVCRGSNSRLDPAVAPGDIASGDLLSKGIPPLPPRIGIMQAVIRQGGKIFPLHSGIRSIVGIKYRSPHSPGEAECHGRAVKIIVLVRGSIWPHSPVPAHSG